MTKGVACRLLHHGAAASSSSKSVICIPSQDPSSSESTEIVYSSHALLNVACRTRATLENQDGNTKKGENIWNVYKTLRTETRAKSESLSLGAVTAAAPARVVTCIAHAKYRVANDPTAGTGAAVVLCGFSDGTVTAWYRESCQWTERVLVDTFSNSYKGRSITDIAGLVGNGRLVLVACTSLGACRFEFNSETMLLEKYLMSSPANTVAFHTIASGATLILVGTASPRHNKIHVYLDDPRSDTTSLGYLTGHEDWVTCFDCCRSSPITDFMASGSQDAKIRLWKFAVAPSEKSQPVAGSAVAHQTMGKDDDGVGADHWNEEDEGESRLHVVYQDTETTVTLEALLIGHEERVTSVCWHPDARRLYGQALTLISSSMDRTIFIWTEHESGIWTPISRVGSAGGILGGSIGSSLLGFVNVLVEPVRGRWLLGHGYGGAMHFFSCESSVDAKETVDQSTMELPVEERVLLTSWRAQPCITGHFDGVVDLCWEAERGDYLATVSNDQTCRLWAPISASATEGNDSDGEVWVEIARPQVHGYNLSAITSLSCSSHRHRLVSAADEKELRVFDATATFLRALDRTLGRNSISGGGDIPRTERAYIPALGLSNKATAADGAEADTTNISESSTQLALERDLGAESLWPEVSKLYGHNAELVRLASTTSSIVGASNSAEHRNDILVASSSKARDVEAASIRLWDMGANRSFQVLSGGHRSTVTALDFSPDGLLLASSGKDRRLCIWERSAAADNSGVVRYGKFSLIAAVDAAHKRIVWSAHFCPLDQTILATGSRDGNVKIWRVTSPDGTEDRTKTIQELYCFSPKTGGRSKKAESVTSLCFAPMALSGSGLLALGLENGFIELWTVPLKGAVVSVSGPSHLLSFPPALCHIATVTKLSWRPTTDDRNDAPVLMLASCSLDHGCRIFEVKLRDELQ